MHGLDQSLKIAPVAKVRIDSREIGYPIAVIARGLVPPCPLDRLVLVDRPQPDRRRTQMLDVLEPCKQPAQIAAVIEPLGSGIESRTEPPPAQPSPIVAGIAVIEPVRQQE